MIKRLQQFLLTKQYQAQGWTEQKATTMINNMGVHEQSKLYLLTIRAVGVVKARQELLAGFAKDFDTEVKAHPGISVTDLTSKYFAEHRFLEVLQKLSLSLEDIKKVAAQAGGKE